MVIDISLTDRFPTDRAVNHDGPNIISVEVKGKAEDARRRTRRSLFLWFLIRESSEHCVLRNRDEPWRSFASLQISAKQSQSKSAIRRQNISLTCDRVNHVSLHIAYNADTIPILGELIRFSALILSLECQSPSPSESIALCLSPSPSWLCPIHEIHSLEIGAKVFGACAYLFDYPLGSNSTHCQINSFLPQDECQIRTSQKSGWSETRCLVRMFEGL